MRQSIAFWFVVAGMAVAILAAPRGQADPGAAPAAPPGMSKLSAQRARQLKDNIKSFALEVSYRGEQDKPYYNLTLSVPPLPGQDRGIAFFRGAQVSPEQAGKMIDCLARSGILDRTQDMVNANHLRDDPTPCYLITVGATDKAAGEVALRGSLGWGLPMLKQLDALRKTLDGPAAKEMDVLLARLAGDRQEWTVAASGGAPVSGGAATQPAAQWQKLYEDTKGYQDYDQPEQVFGGTLGRIGDMDDPAAPPPAHRYQLDERVVYPGRANAALDKLVGQVVEIRGKARDSDADGQSVHEIWAGAVRLSPAAADAANSGGGGGGTVRFTSLPSILDGGPRQAGEAMIKTKEQWDQQIAVCASEPVRQQLGRIKVDFTKEVLVFVAVGRFDFVLTGSAQTAAGIKKIVDRGDQVQVEYTFVRTDAVALRPAYPLFVAKMRKTDKPVVFTRKEVSFAG